MLLHTDSKRIVNVEPRWLGGRKINKRFDWFGKFSYAEDNDIVI